MFLGWISPPLRIWGPSLISPGNTNLSEGAKALLCIFLAGEEWRHFFCFDQWESSLLDFQSDQHRLGSNETNKLGKNKEDAELGDLGPRPSPLNAFPIIKERLHYCQGGCNTRPGLWCLEASEVNHLRTRIPYLFMLTCWWLQKQVTGTMPYMCG